MRAAVILMAYGSPDRLSDVPAYYADIRGGRPIAPEHLRDLVARYEALGVGDGDFVPQPGEPPHQVPARSPAKGKALWCRGSAPDGHARSGLETW